jgi:hypothetical protein
MYQLSDQRLRNLLKSFKTYCKTRSKSDQNNAGEDRTNSSKASSNTIPRIFTEVW